MAKLFTIVSDAEINPFGNGGADGLTDATQDELQTALDFLFRSLKPGESITIERQYPTIR